MSENQLASLLLNLFEPDELERFVRHAFGRSISARLDKHVGTTEAVYAISEELSNRGLVTPNLFDQLLDYRPDSKELIDRVRQSMLGEKPDEAANPLESVETSEVDDEIRAKWREKLSAVLHSEGQRDSRPPQPWVDAAAVLAHFNPPKLRPVHYREERDDDGGGLVSIAELCDTRADGRWQLQPTPRRKAINKLWSSDRIIDALNANPHEESIHTSLLRELVDRRWLDVRGMKGYDTLVAAYEIADWFADSEFQPLDADKLASILERQRTIEPLRKLIGVHFRGRVVELEKIRDHAQPAQPGEPRILCLSGIGGVGKSSLLGKLLMEMDSSDGTTRPWVYLDFDNPDVDPTNPRGMIQEIAKQLSLLYETSDDSDDRDFLGLESVAANDQGGLFKLDIEHTDGIDVMIDALDRAIRALPMKASFLLVLDTLEQIQVQGARTLLAVREFVDKLQSRLPYAQVIVSGRSEVPEWHDATNLVLKQLDTESADQVLLALRVENEKLRHRVVTQVGTLPLSLRLAASAIVSGKLDESDMEELVRETQEINRQGQLYTRILAHIPDLQVRRLAHPGLIVRRVTPGVIENVLADACDLDKHQANELFERLPNFVALFEPDEHAPDETRALRHRQDVRQTMLRLMMEDAVWQPKIETIHDAAVLHYQDRDHPITRAEELYHRLMRDDELSVLDELWSSELRDSLSRCWNEPLPQRARTWLGLRLGHQQGDVQRLRTIDWEVSAQREAAAQLEADDPKAALATLRARGDRTAGSPLYRLEIDALSRCGKQGEAIELLPKAIRDTVDAGNLQEALKLHLLGAEIALEQSDPKSVLDHAKRASKLAQQMEDRGSYLRALEFVVLAKQRDGTADELTDSLQSLGYAFSASDDAVLEKQSDIAKRVVQMMGSDSKTVLKKAARVFGNRVKQDVIKHDAFQLEEMLARMEGTEAGKMKLAKLASEVGLSRDKFELVDLAGQMIRYGRMGDALVEVLDQVGDDEEVRQQATSIFHK